MPPALVRSHTIARRGAQSSAPGPLSIALVSTQRGFRGGEIQLRLLAHGFRAAGERPLIYARRGGPLAERLTDEGFSVFTFCGSGFSPAALWQLRQRLKADRPDVLYCNDSHALSSAGAASYGLDIGLRVASRRVAFPIRSSWKYRQLCDVVLANCHATVDICAAGGIPCERIHVVHDGVPPLGMPAVSRVECRQRLGLSQLDQIALTVAALTEEKGHAVLLAALPDVMRAHPRFHWLVAGDGPLRDSLVAQAAALGVADRVHFLGQRNDIADLMAAADLVVLPSLCEGLCNAAIEAQYASVPLVTSDTGGLADVVGSRDPAGPTGWLAEPGDVHSLAQAMINALGDADTSRRLTDRGRERAVQLFNVDRMIAETLAKFRELLARTS